jgi:hypothetical protein
MLKKGRFQTENRKNFENSNEQQATIVHCVRQEFCRNNLPDLGTLEIRCPLMAQADIYHKIAIPSDKGVRDGVTGGSATGSCKFEKLACLGVQANGFRPFICGRIHPLEFEI